MKPVTTWILVADGARAQIFVNRGPGKGLEASDRPELTAAHPPSSEIGSDRPGRTHDRYGPARHAMTPHVDWHQFEKTKFAKEVAGLLNRAGEEKAFDRLVLVAPPKALGDLRAALGKRVSGLVTGELSKDLTHVAIRDLPGHLENTIAL